MGIAEILILDNKLSTSTREGVQIIIQCGNILYNLVNDILDLSKMESGKLVLSEQPGKIQDIVSSIFSILSVKAREKELELVIEVEECFPKLVLIDADRLGQVLLNLVGNAIKFTDQGFVKVCVTKQLDNNQSFILFRITDTGIGISDDFVENLFKEFSQGFKHSTTPGTGLGLSITKKAIDLMRGSIWLEETKRGVGSTFAFKLLLKEVSESIYKTKNSNVISKNISIMKKFPESFILIVDDNFVNRKICGNAVGKLKCKHEFAANGEIAYKMVKQAAKNGQHFGVVLMDIQMPVMNGVESTNAIRDLGQEIVQPKIIAITAHLIPGQEEMLKEEGFDACLPKPISVQALLENLTSILTNILKISRLW